jgi:Recombinational DNA repair ATPase (RecF pathway)
VQLLAAEQDYFGCVLIDDFAAELDSQNRGKLLDFLAALKCQVFITANSTSDFGDLSQLPSYKMFHVEHGSIKPM